MVDESIDCSNGHCRVDKDVAPLRERRVRRDRDAFSFVSFGNEFKEHRRFRLIAAHVTQIVQDEQIETIEFSELLRQAQVAPSGLEALYKVAAAREEHASTGVDERVPDRTK